MRERLHLIVGLGMAPGGQRNGLGSGTRAALAAAAAAARRGRGVHVTLVHATGREGEAWPPRPLGEVATTNPTLALDAESALAELRAAGATADFVVTSGAAVPALARRALFDGADLVVIGRTEGADGNAGLGPTAAALVRTAPCAVWVVDARHSYADAGLLVSARDRCSLAAAGHLARALRAPVHVANASKVPLASAPACGERARRAHFDEARRRLASEGHAAFRAVCDARIEPQLHIGFDEPQPFFHALAQRLRPSAVVFDPNHGAGADDAPERWHERVADFPTSVIVVRSPQFESPYATSALYESN